MLADGTPQENAIVSDSIRNVTICKDVYSNMYGAVADCLREAFNYMEQESTDRIEKEIRLNYFFINFNNKNNARDLAYAHFFNELGRFPGSLDLAVVPQGDIPNFIQATVIISPSDSDARGLVSVKFLASFHVYLGGSLNISKKAPTEFYHNLSMQALSISSDQTMLKFDAIVELVKSIAQLLRDNVEAAIVHTRENDRFFASVLAKTEKNKNSLIQTK